MLKTIGAQVKDYKLASILTPVSIIVEVIAEMLIPRCMGSIIDNGIKKNDMSHIYIMGIVMVILALISLAGGSLGGVFGAKASAGLAKNLRKAMYEKVQTYSFSNIDKFSTAGIVTRMTTDVTNVQNSYQMILRMCTRGPMVLLVAMVFSFTISPKLASVYLIAVVILSSLLFIIAKLAMKYFEQVFKKYDELNNSVQENVTAIRVVKAYVREDHEKSKFVKASENVYKMFVKAESIVVFNMPLMQLTTYICILVISFFGAKMIVVKDLSEGNLANLLAYCMNILVSLMILSMVFVMVSISIASAERIAEILNEEPDIVNPENPVMEVKDGSIEFRNVCFKYNKDATDNVLDNINLKINSGEVIGILGSTGSAKTSLVNLISRLYDVTEGSVLLGGVDVREYDLEVLRNDVSVVLQKNVLFKGTILDNLRWGKKDATLEECKEACKMACADEFIDKMEDGYDTLIEQGGSNVSGGQRQRLCIARALLKNPKVLILDDSTSAVDTNTDEKIRKAFAQSIPGTTKIIIAQRVSSIMNCDRIIIMDEGKVNGFGTHDELLAGNEIYKDVFESQTAGSGDFDEGGR
ncbi:ABC transporter ATP-binding protein [uncultured Eubacterium sp.]|uniref:ABC transporter ATP-binding protein n=1 Tax=uncultured Eubacterium sp. TaxID=165185 RepID=UPI002593A577|nr:ABC transporter ATP-binding protein [uncultured Eubacterium sp.]